MSEYGYIPEAPEQSFGNNKGIFTPKDIYDLTRADKYTNYGQLELIETQTTSGTPSAVNFTSLGNYNVHFITATNTSTSTDDGRIGIRLSNDGGSSYESSNYQTAYQANAGDGGVNEYRSTSDNQMEFIINTGTNANEKGNGYIYLYNLGDSSKYSFATGQAVALNSSANLFEWFGSSVYAVAETINALSIIPDGASGTLDNDIVFSLYGIKEYS